MAKESETPNDVQVTEAGARYLLGWFQNESPESYERAMSSLVEYAENSPDLSPEYWIIKAGDSQ